jgi:hypothetical protein
MISIGTFAMAQELNKKNVPGEVKSKFSSLYPGIKVETWKRQGVNYEASFDLNKRDVYVSFTSGGELLYTKTEITKDDLLPAIKDYMNKNYPGEKIEKATHYKLATDSVNYSAKTEKMEVVFDSNGGFIRKQ